VGAVVAADRLDRPLLPHTAVRRRQAPEDHKPWVAGRSLDPRRGTRHRRPTVGAPLLSRRLVANPDHRAEQACVDDSLTRQRNHSLPHRGFQQSSRPVFLVHASGTTGPGRQNTGRPRSGPRPREALGARPSPNQRLHLLLVTRRARVSCGVCSEPEIGCVRRTAVRTRSEHLPNIWGIRGFGRIHICPGNREFCDTLPDARAPSHGGDLHCLTTSDVLHATSTPPCVSAAATNGQARESALLATAHGLRARLAAVLESRDTTGTHAVCYNHCFPC
jgi:hypothetical protein